MKKKLHLPLFFLLLCFIVSPYNSSYEAIVDDEQTFSQTSSSFELSTNGFGSKQAIKGISFYTINSLSDLSFSLPNEDWFQADIQKRKTFSHLFPIKFQSTFISISSFTFY